MEIVLQKFAHLVDLENYKHLKTMKKSESTSRKETPVEELKRLRKENKSLKTSKVSLNTYKDKLKAEKVNHQFNVMSCKT